MLRSCDEEKVMGERSRSGEENREKSLGVLMGEKSGMCKCPAAYEVENAEERLDIKIS